MAANHGNDLSAQMRAMPSVDELLGREELATIAIAAGPRRLAEFIRVQVDSLRDELRVSRSATVDHDTDAIRMALRDRAIEGVVNAWKAEVRSRLIEVINATGVVIHTNLGRAPLSEAARRAIAEASNYSTVEFDLESGKRGRRGAAAERMIARLAGAEDALIVNNCAAAALLVLASLAQGGSVIVSRGELVEIGGDFRIPDVLAQSGCVLKEVGTTNRTKLSDYAKAISADTKMIMRVHPSNYRIVGFTATPRTQELASLARETGTIFFEDAGSGALVDLSHLGLRDEPIISRSIADGVDVAAFSGDKLLGGPQAGIIAGKGDLVAKVRRHPLYRALRAGKLVYAAMEATLSSYDRGSESTNVPVIKMLSMSIEEIETRADAFCRKLNSSLADPRSTEVRIERGKSAVGGGASPDFQPESALIVFSNKSLSANKIEARLRARVTPVIARIEEGSVILDLRTVTTDQEAELLQAVIFAVEGEE